MSGETGFNFRADFAPVHVNRQIAVVPEVQRSPRILIGKPTDPPRGADHSIWGGNGDALARREQLLGGLPYGLEGIDETEDGTVAL